MEAITREERDGRLRLSWDNRRLRQDRLRFWLLVGAWCLWTPATLYATYQAVAATSGERWFFVVWCLGGWAGTLGLPHVLAQRSWREWLELDADSLAWGAKGWLAGSPRRVPLAQVAQFAFVRDASGEDTDLVCWLRIHTQGAAGTRQHLPGYWLNAELKRRVFDQVAAFVRRERLPLRLTDADAEAEDA